MVDEPNSRVRLAELRERWELDRSSRLFLQLAEEYRRQGRPDQAIPILEEGLRNHPGSGAARVALGRCRLEAGEPLEAVEVLERVVGRDPTQMVAYRSLVDAYVALGDAERARDRLGPYAQLNPQDPALEEIAKRVEAVARRSSSSSGVTELRGDRAAPDHRTPVAGRSSTLGSGSSTLGSGSSTPGSGSSTPGSGSSTGVSRSSTGVDRGSSPPSLAAQTALPRPPRVPGAPHPRRAAASVAARGGAASARSASIWSGPLAAGVAGILGSLVLDPTRLPPPPRLVLLPARVLVRIAAATVEADPAPTPPTATLASLYFDQGHVSEAREIFQGVLTRDPGNREAQRGLEQAAATVPARPALHARDLVGALGPGAAGLAGKKAQVLRAYLGRLKSAASQVDVS